MSLRSIGFTGISLRNQIPKMSHIFLTGGAYAPYATDENAKNMRKYTTDRMAFNNSAH